MKLRKPDKILYCETGSEHQDNDRFLGDCEKWFDQEVIRLKSSEYADTWNVWEKRQYISGIKGAPCTYWLKVVPRLEFQEPDDIHIFGYTADSSDQTRFSALKENWPDLIVQAPLIERGLFKVACLSLLKRSGIDPPVTYEQGFPNANCLPCCKATSPAYWALVRKWYPDQFERMAKLSRKLGARLARVNGERVFVDEVPGDQSVVEPIAPECDFLCSLTEEELSD